MKIILIPTFTAAFLLYLVMAERNRPTRLTEVSDGTQTERDEGRIFVPRDGNPMNLQRHPRTFRATRSSRNPRIPGTLRQGRPFALSGGSSQTPKRSFVGKSEHVRRSLVRGPNKFNAVLLEPAFHLAPTKGLLSHTFGKRHESLGPLIGPLKLLGIGEEVYVRLLEPSDNEGADHVTVHLLIARKTTEILNEIQDSTNFEDPRNLEPSFSYPEKAQFQKFSTFATIRPRRPMVSSSMAFNGRPLLDHSRGRHGNTPTFKVESPYFVRNENHPMVPKHNIQSLKNIRPTEFDIRPAEHLVAPNHHKLPVARWPVENLIDLPIYPPLSFGKPKEVAGDGCEVMASPVNTGVADGGKQSDSANHTSVQLRDNSASGEVKQRSVNLSMNREEETKIRRRFIEPVFMDKIPSRHFVFDRHVSSPISMLRIADTAEDHFMMAAVPNEEEWRGLK
ncbi:uncharacterized protein LOC124174996 [Neodiprion fabricii]|uniref:uncharacterized protein LOC124174996 n=1 Tax=Neodiprion fabricii TaxID=2872261 RepID=UPI001ED90839|nr:uncharacterized protein LOC124174996 [Neodiprion fabricii]